MTGKHARIFLGSDGPMRTAALLLAIAFVESRFNPTAIGDHGASFGLFQIQPPTAHLHANALLLPRDAAPVAIKLVKTSLRVCGEYGWHERLGWYGAGGNGCKEAGRRATRPHMMLFDQIVEDNPMPSVTKLLSQGDKP